MLFRTRPNRPELDATTTPTPINIAWAAGIFEGEGHVRLCGRGKRSFAASVVQKDTELLYWLRDWFGGSVRLAHAKTRPEHLQVHQWDICGDRARVFTAIIYPFLTSRRKAQIDATGALDFLCGQEKQTLSMQEVKDALLSHYESHFRTTVRHPENRRNVARERYATDAAYREKRKAETRRYKASLKEPNKIVSIA